jgi:DNA-binding MarR family transcriptional regulator
MFGTKIIGERRFEMNDREMNIQLYENLRRVSRKMKWMNHGRGMAPHGHGGHGPCHMGMHRPEGMMPEAKPMGPHPHGPRRLPRERILAVLNEREEGMRQKELAEILMIHPSSLSEAVDKLEADRYIERTVDPADKRATIITLTEKGKARAYEVMDERQAAAAEVFRNLSEEEKQTLLVLLDKITADKE